MSTQTKIELKGGYTNEYFPFGTYNNYTMVVALANYSTNGAVKYSALFMLDEKVSAEDKKQRLRSEGGFFVKACTGTFGQAFTHADGGNRKALITALEANELQL